MPTRPQHEHPIRQINHYGAAPTHHSHMALALITAVTRACFMQTH